MKTFQRQNQGQTQLKLGLFLLEKKACEYPKIVKSHTLMIAEKSIF